MMRWPAVRWIPALLLFLPGCVTSRYCLDGSGRSAFHSGYKGCARQCVKRGKECGCSTRCPCWKEH